MTKENGNGLLVGALCVIMALVLISMYVSFTGRVDQNMLSNDITARVLSGIPKPQTINVDEIATQVAGKISVPSINIPEFKSDEKVQDLWENLYADNISEIETEAYDVAVDKLENRDYKLLTEWLENNVVGFDELKNVDIDDYDVNVINLGLSEDEDKVAEVVFELKIRYSLIEGQATSYKKNVIATALVTFDEGDYDDENVELVFA